jgi:RNA polymerase subunit RPABC4/transcription elongation factor Spt4
MPFSALRCGACGTPVAGAPLADERVRPCLQCGVILRFDQDPCPQCGARARTEPEVDRVKPCVRCTELIPFEQFYCGKCGELSIPIQTDPVAPDVELEPRAPLSAAAGTLLGGVAFAMGCGALWFAVDELLR